MMGACSTTAAPASQATLLVKEDPRWALWVLVVVALGILSIAVQEYRKDNRGEAERTHYLLEVSERFGEMTVAASREIRLSERF